MLIHKIWYENQQVWPVKTNQLRQQQKTHYVPTYCTEKEAYRKIITFEKKLLESYYRTKLKSD